MASWVAGNRGFTAGGASSLSTGSLTTSGANRFMRALAFIGTGGTPADPTGVKWDSAGVNESFTSFQAGTTFATSFRGNPWHITAPTAKAAVGTATWAASHDETMLLADAYDGIDQTTPARTPPTATTATAATATITVASVADDIVVGSAVFGRISPELTTITSSTLTIREKVEGADIGGYEACGQGDVVATGSSTVASIVCGNTATPTYYMYGVALIPAAGGPAADSMMGRSIWMTA